MSVKSSSKPLSYPPWESGTYIWQSLPHCTWNTGTAVTQVAPGADQIYHQQDKCTQKRWPRDFHPPGLPRVLQGPFPFPQKCLAPEVRKDLHTSHEPTRTAVPQVDPWGDQKLRQHDQHTNKCQTHGYHPTWVIRTPQCTSPVPNDCLTPSVGQG